MALLLIACRLTAILVLVVSLWLFRQTPSLAEPTHPKTCQVGIYITSLRDFKLADKSFTADFRVWSVCPDKDLKPLETMEIIDTIEYEASHDTTLNKKNESGLFSTKNEVYWSKRDTTATLYHNWDVNNYPFDEPYAFPLARVVQIVRLDKSDISVVEGRQYFTRDGINIGLIAAHQVLELAEPSDVADALCVVVIGDQSNIYGLVVDKFLGERDLVVRPLDPRFGKVRDISASALMDDGSPVLIVDVSDLMQSTDKLLNSSYLSKVSLDKPKIANNRKRILVVDDSITVREMQCKLLQNQGYDVDVAVNGTDGWSAIRSNHYDLVISDIDMPSMNGIELTKQIRSNPNTHATPVIIVSYRDHEEDRIQGLEAGADYYITKSSFQDYTLVNAVADLIGCN